MYCVLLLLVWVGAAQAASHVRDTCPPPCQPPSGLKACHVYKMAAHCPNGWSDIRISSGACSCLWKDYIEDLQHSDMISNDCYIWTLRTCTIEESVKLAASNAAAPKDILTKVLALEKAQGMVKHRRRNGVDINVSKAEPGEVNGRLTVDAHGVYGKMEQKAAKKAHPIYGTIDRSKTAKPKKDKSPIKKSKVKAGRKPEPRRRVNLERLQTKKPQTMHPQLLGKFHPESGLPWMSFGMKDDRFRLFVMGVLFLANTIFFILAASCKFDKKVETKETRPAGDLDPFTYRRRSDRNNNNPGFLESVIGKFRPQDDLTYQECYLPPYGAVTKKTRESERGAHGGSQRSRSRGLYDQAADLENLIGAEYDVRDSHSGRQARARTSSSSSSKQKQRANKSATQQDGKQSKSSHSSQSLRAMHSAMAEYQPPPPLMMPTIDSFKRHPAPRTSSP